MGGSCSTYVGEVSCVLVGKPEGKRPLRRPRRTVHGRITLKWISREWDGGMDLIDLPQDRERWLALVNAVMKLRVT